MCMRCAELEEEVAYLKGELGLSIDTTLNNELRDRHNLSPSDARLLCVLSDAKGRVLSRVQLAEAIGSESINADSLEVYVWRIRKRLGKEAIKTAWGQGYAIGPLGAKAVTEARKAVAR